MEYLEYLFGVIRLVLSKFLWQLDLRVICGCPQPANWLEMQNRHNIWKLERKNRLLYEQIHRVDAA